MTPPFTPEDYEHRALGDDLDAELEAMLTQAAATLRRVAQMEQELAAIRLFMYQRKDDRGLDLAATNSAINRLSALLDQEGS